MSDPFRFIASPFREMVEEIDPESYYVFSENLSDRKPRGCRKLPAQASASDLLRAQNSMGGAARSKTLKGRDVRALILTLAEAHGQSIPALIDLGAKPNKVSTDD